VAVSLRVLPVIRLLTLLPVIEPASAVSSTGPLAPALIMLTLRPFSSDTKMPPVPADSVTAPVPRFVESGASALPIEALAPALIEIEPPATRVARLPSSEIEPASEPSDTAAVPASTPRTV
jgi:hypothetical protein